MSAGAYVKKFAVSHTHLPFAKIVPKIRHPMLKYLLRMCLYLAAAGLAQAAGAAQTPRANPPSVPPSPPPQDTLTNAINPGLRARIASEHRNWKATKGGAEFQTAFNYAGGAPILMFVTTPNESADRQRRRLKAIVSACEFMMDSDAFDFAVLCVVEMNGAHSSSAATRNTRVTRARFEEAIRNAGASSEMKAAIARVYADPRAIRAVCDALNIR